MSWAARRARLMSILEERKAELVSLPRIEHELKQLEANVTATEAAYDIVDKGLKEADIKFSYATPEVWLVSHAGPPQLPSGPRRATITAASLLAGVVTAIGLAALLEFMNSGVPEHSRRRGMHWPACACDDPPHLQTALATCRTLVGHDRV